MPYIDVNIDLDDFETYDLIEELEVRLESKYCKTKEEIFDFCRKSLGIEKTQSGIHTLEDELKLKSIHENIQKFTLEEIETFFKSK